VNKSILYPALLLLVTSIANAQTDDQDESESSNQTEPAPRLILPLPELRLPSIQVIGAGTVIERSDIAGAAAYISRQDLQESQPLSTQDALRRVAGVHLREEEGFGFIPNIGLRGLTPDRSGKVLVLEDGVPVAPSLFINNASYYSPRIERMQAIEVLKGASSLRYGPHTIGGTVNYLTKEPFDGTHLTVSAGSHGFGMAMLETGMVSGNAHGGFNLLASRGDGARDNGFELVDVMLKGGFSIGDNQAISAKFSYYDNDINTSYVGLRPDEFRDHPGKNPAPDDVFLTTRVAFDLNHEIDLSDQIRLNTLAYWSQLDRDFWRRDVIGRDRSGTTFRPCDGTRTCTGGRVRTFTMVGINSRLRIEHGSFGVSNRTEIGVRLHSEELDNRRINGFDVDARSGVLAGHDDQFADNIALYVENRFDFGNGLTLTPGLRVERYDQKRINRRPGNPEGAIRGTTSNTEYMPGLGLTWQAHEAIQLYSGIYRGFAPARVASAISSSGVDQQLDAERSLNIEAGMRGRLNGIRYELTGFQMDFDNQIIPQAESAGITETNAGKTLHRGVELTLGLPLGGGFSLDANTTWLPVARFESTPLLGNDIKGNRLVYAPRHLANVGLNWRQGPWQVGLNGSHVSSQFADAENTVAESDNGQVGRIAGFTTFDLTANYQISERIRLFGTIRNLADKTYIAGRQPDGIFPGIERTLRTGLTARF
jgi:Fe(3+) dicitrate transport protein